MNSFYTTLILLCVLACISMICHVRSAATDQIRKWFTLLYVGIILGAAMECFGVWMDSTHAALPTLRLIVKLVEFCVIPLLSCCVAFGCGMEKAGKPLLCLGLAHVSIELVLSPFGKIISVTSDGVYQRGPWYFIYIVVYAISALYILCCLVTLSQRFKHRDRKTIICVLMTMFCGVIPSFFHTGVQTSFLGITLGSIVLYLYYEGLTLQDQMTSLTAQNEYIQKIQHRIIYGIADLIESRDSSTGTHVKDTASYAAIIAEEAIRHAAYPAEIDDTFAKSILSAAALHDVGKITVSDTILLKPGKLTEEEFKSMKQHAAEGGRIVRSLLNGITDDAYSRMAIDIASHHHEKWNGSGYPDGLAAEEIPVAARVVAIADVYDALVAERVYKKPMPPEEALDFIEQNSGSSFDPVLGPLFVQRMRADLTKNDS